MCVISNTANMFSTKVKFNVSFGPPIVILWCATQIPSSLRDRGPYSPWAPECWLPMAHTRDLPSAKGKLPCATVKPLPVGGWHPVAGWCRVKYPVSLPQFRTSLKGYPCFSSPCGICWTQAAAAWQVSFSCPIQLPSPLTVLFLRALPNQLPICTSQSLFSGEPNLSYPFI